jgi:hypothetical protein
MLSDSSEKHCVPHITEVFDVISSYDYQGVKTMIKTLLTLLLFPVILIAQNASTPPLPDTLAIKQTALNYIEGYYQSDGNRMRKAIHPELAKRVIVRDDAGNMMLQNMGSSQLIYNTKRNRNSNILNPDQPFKADITIYDIFGKVANVKVTTNKYKFIDYLHLGKIDGEWKIINVLWEMTE